MSCNNAEKPLRAPELLLDLLIASDRPLSVRALYRAGTLLGVNEVAIRVALTRLLAQDKIRQMARGVYAINLAGGPLLRDVDDWRNKEGQMEPWTGAWVAVHDAAVPRSDKTTWRHHGLALAMRGFARLQPGLHLRPDNLAGGVAGVRAQLQALGLAPQALVYRMTELEPAQHAQAATLWQVARLRQVYRERAEALRARTDALRGTRDVRMLRESLLLGREAIGLIVRDPLLPPALMPARERRALVKATARYQDSARRLWNGWLHDAD